VLQSFISDKHKIKNYSAGIESRSRIQQWNKLLYANNVQSKDHTMTKIQNNNMKCV
jgi:hypothetical protein